jgi:hypothetical protein
MIPHYQVKSPRCSNTYRKRLEKRRKYGCTRARTVEVSRKFCINGGRKRDGLLASSIVQAQDAFHIGLEDVNKAVNQCRSLIANGKQFAVLIPVSITGEIARLEISDGDRRYDDELLKKVEGFSKIILAQDAEMWLLNLTNHRVNEFVSVHQQGLNETQSREIIQWDFDRFRSAKANQVTLDDDNVKVANTDPHPYPAMLPITRSRRNVASGGNSSIHTPAANSVLGESQADSTVNGRIAPVIQERRIRWKRQPREPLPHLEDVSEWVGKQLDHMDLPKKYQSVLPEGELVPLAEDYPEGLFAIHTE